MKVVFLQPKSFHTWESLNIGYMAAYLKKWVPDVHVEFYTEFFDTQAEIKRGCKGADVIGISATSPQYARGYALARMVKRNDNYVVMGGYHVTNIDYQKCDYVDQIVKGEGEQAMAKICLGEHVPSSREDLLDINKIPWPDRDVINVIRNMFNCEKKFGKRIISMLANRGCPYRCSFCSGKTIFPQTRYRQAEDIFHEFDDISIVFDAEFVKFCDDEMGTNREQLIKFCELKTKSRNKLPWGCNAVAKNLCDPEIAELMKAANCEEVWMGVESGDENLLKSMRKPCTIEQIKTAFKITKDAGIKRRAYCIIGMPDESYDTLMKTENLIDEIQPDVVGFTIVAPYPGNDFYKPEMRDIDWSNVDEYQNTMTTSKYLTNRELIEAQKKMTRKYNKILTDRQAK